jgi:hypothetical protein
MYECSIWNTRNWSIFWVPEAVLRQFTVIFLLINDTHQHNLLRFPSIISFRWEEETREHKIWITVSHYEIQSAGEYTSVSRLLSGDANSFTDMLISVVPNLAIRYNKEASLLSTATVQNHWVFGLCPSSGIPENKTQHFGNWISFRPRLKGEGRHLLNWVP